MRIRNLVIQGLIASAILLLPTAVFADRGDLGREQHSSGQQNRDYDNNRSHDNQTRYRNEGKTAEHRENNNNDTAANARYQNRSEKHVQTRWQNSNVHQQQPGASQQIRRWHNNKNESDTNNNDVSRRTTERQKENTSKQIHKTTTLPKPVSKPVIKPIQSKATVVKEKKKAGLTNALPKHRIDKARRIQTVQSIPIDRPLEKVPENPDGKMLPVNISQSSTHTSNDGGYGAGSNGSMKASIALPIIFYDDEQVMVYFSRLDLLRSQWVNAPPSTPPKAAL
jgi:hypothetical protein